MKMDQQKSKHMTISMRTDNVVTLTLTCDDPRIWGTMCRKCLSMNTCVEIHDVYAYIEKRSRGWNIQVRNDWQSERARKKNLHPESVHHLTCVLCFLMSPIFMHGVTGKPAVESLRLWQIVREEDKGSSADISWCSPRCYSSSFCPWQKQTLLYRMLQ